MGYVSVQLVSISERKGSYGFIVEVSSLEETYSAGATPLLPFRICDGISICESHVNAL